MGCGESCFPPASDASPGKTIMPHASFLAPWCTVARVSTVEIGTQVLPPLRREASTQTDRYTPSLSTNEITEMLARFHLSVISRQTVRQTLYRELANRLKMPCSLTAEMRVVMDFPGIPAPAWKMVFPPPTTEWMTSEDGETQTGLLLSMAELNNTIDMKMRLACNHVIGCTRLHLPPSAQVGKTLISLAPPLQIWIKKEPDGAVSSMVTCWIVLLDESGDLRTPPNHPYSDEEEELIQETLRENLKTMILKDWPLSPTFLKLLGESTKAAEVEEALEEYATSMAARKRRRMEKKEATEEAEEAEEAGEAEQVGG